MTKKAKLQNRQIRRVYKQTGGRELDGRTITFTQFKHRVQARAKAEGITIRKAANREKNTLSFTSAAERSRTNLIDSIKEKYGEEFHKLTDINRKLRDEKGHFTSMRANMKWSTEYNAYMIGNDETGIFIIDVSNSPEQIYLTQIK